MIISIVFQKLPSYDKLHPTLCEVNNSNNPSTTGRITTSEGHWREKKNKKKKLVYMYIASSWI